MIVVDTGHFIITLNQPDVVSGSGKEMTVMGDTCHIRGCSDTSYDDCTVCHKPTCRRHGKRVGDHFVCRECADRA